MIEGAFWDLLLTDGALSHWQMSHERLSLSFSTVLSSTCWDFFPPLLPVRCSEWLIGINYSPPAVG